MGRPDRSRRGTETMVVPPQPVGDPEGPTLRVDDHGPPGGFGPHPQERLLDGVVGLVVVESESATQAEQLTTTPVVDVGYCPGFEGQRLRGSSLGRSGR